MRVGEIACLVLCGAALSSADVHSASFESLGQLPFGLTSSYPLDMSADGNRIVGIGTATLPGGGTRREGFLWTPATGMQPFSALPGGFANGELFSVSADGSTFIGGSPTNMPAQRFRYRPADAEVQTFGLTSDGQMLTIAGGLSGDGNIIVGTNVGNAALRFDEGVGLTKLPTTMTVTPRSVSDVSDDGRYIIGSAVVDTAPFGTLPVLRNGGYRLGPGGYETFATGTPGLAVNLISGDGQSAYGYYVTTGPTLVSYRWTPAAGLEPLDFNFGGQSSVGAASFDGSVVVGSTSNAPFGVVNGPSNAWVWTEANGITDLKSLLVNDLGLTNAADWTLWLPTGISADGTVITGYGANPAGRLTAWRAVIPEPGAGSVCVTLAVGLLRRRRSSARPACS